MKRLSRLQNYVWSAHIKTRGCDADILSDEDEVPIDKHRNGIVSLKALQEIPDVMRRSDFASMDVQL